MNYKLTKLTKPITVPKLSKPKQPTLFPMEYDLIPMEPGMEGWRFQPDRRTTGVYIKRTPAKPRT